jgi:hypothetical protein
MAVYAPEQSRQAIPAIAGNLVAFLLQNDARDHPTITTKVSQQHPLIRSSGDTALVGAHPDQQQPGINKVAVRRINHGAERQAGFA